MDIDQLRYLATVEPEPLRKAAYQRQLAEAETIAKNGPLAKGMDDAVELPITKYLSLAINNSQYNEDEGTVYLTYLAHGYHDASSIHTEKGQDPAEIAKKIAGQIRPHTDAIGQIWDDANRENHVPGFSMDRRPDDARSTKPSASDKAAKGDVAKAYGDEGDDTSAEEYVRQSAPATTASYVAEVAKCGKLLAGITYSLKRHAAGRVGEEESSQRIEAIRAVNKLLKQAYDSLNQ